MRGVRYSESLVPTRERTKWELYRRRVRLESSVATIKTSEKVMVRFCIQYKRYSNAIKGYHTKVNVFPHFAFPI